jgi:hypothetical protein
MHFSEKMVEFQQQWRSVEVVAVFVSSAWPKFHRFLHVFSTSVLSVPQQAGKNVILGPGPRLELYEIWHIYEIFMWRMDL